MVKKTGRQSFRIRKSLTDCPRKWDQSSHRAPSWAGSEGLLKLGPAAFGQPGCRIGDCGGDQSRDDSSHAQKNEITDWKIQYWVIPPESDTDFSAAMEEVLAVYARPLDPEHSVVCMDEQPIELLKELRRVITGTRIHAKRVDYEYERAGTASIFMFC